MKSSALKRLVTLKSKEGIVAIGPDFVIAIKENPARPGECVVFLRGVNNPTAIEENMAEVAAKVDHALTYSRSQEMLEDLMAKAMPLILKSLGGETPP